MTNFLQVSPSTGSAISKITKEIRKVLINEPSDTSLEIQFKYAEFKQFCLIPEQFYNRLPAQAEKFSNMYIQSQRYLHLQSLKRLSNQNMILLNQLGSQMGRIYQIESQFKNDLNKFYWIRDFLIKSAKASNNRTPQQYNFFRTIVKAQNNIFKVTQNDQLRLDIIIMNSGQMDGRYSYSQGQGWSKVNKKLLVKWQLDIMMSQKLFRLAINDQRTSTVHHNELQAIRQIINNNSKNSKKKKYIIRLKRALRVQKNREVQFSLSQVYQPQDPAFQLHELSQLITGEPTQLDAYLFRSFQKFYSSTTKQNETKFQVQSQFTQHGVQTLRKIAKQCSEKKDLTQLQRKIQISLEDLYALSWCEHRQKVEQKNLFQKMSKQKLQDVKGRLENQFGSYMRDLIYNEMTYSCQISDD